jgi:O-antigen/teichoic acid export membrane protein
MVSITLSKRTDLLIWATLLGAAVNIAANLLLIPSMGMMGAAWATFLSYAAMAACLYVMGQRVYPIPYEYLRIIHLLAVTAIMAGAGLAVSGYYSQGGGITYAAARCGVLAILPIALWVTGFFTAEERSALRRALTTR